MRLTLSTSAILLSSLLSVAAQESAASAVASAVEPSTVISAAPSAGPSDGASASAAPSGGASASAGPSDGASASARPSDGASASAGPSDGASAGVSGSATGSVDASASGSAGASATASGVAPSAITSVYTSNGVPVTTVIGGAGASAGASGTASALVPGASGTTGGAGTTEITEDQILDFLFNDVTEPCHSALSDFFKDTGDSGTCLHTSILFAAVNSNSSLNIPIADYLNASCTGEPCSNSTLSYATKVILDSCQTELVKSNVENKTVISYFESYPLIREMLCLKTTDPFNGTLTAEHDPKHKANWTAFTPSEINFTHPYWNTSFATSELPTNGSANPKRENGGAAAETTPVPQVIEPDSQTGTDQTTKNASYCLLSLVNEYETYVGHNLTVPWIAGIATGSNQTAINASNHIPVEAICTECVYGALDLAAQGSPWLANLTIGNNYTLFSFVNETCFDLGFRINNNGTLPKSILPGAVNSTYGHNITYFNASLAQASGGAGGSSNTSDLSDWFTRVAPNSTGNISNVTDETPSDAAPSTTYTYTTTITDANGSAVPSVVTGTETLTSGAVTTPAPSASGGAGSATASGDASATASGSAAPSGEVSGSAVPSAEPSGSAAPSAEPSAEPSGSAAASQEPSAVTSEAPAASETATNTDTMSANASTAPARFALRRHARDWRL